MARVREQAVYWWQSPNPIWVRELRQSARLTRTPFILMAVAAFSALLLCTIGGVMTGSSDPASIGVALHQTFFSIAFFVVTVAGPTLAANSIASEREGRTWEALQLTGLAPGVIARGKFTSAFTNIAMYVVMMAPVGALPFLFGGVTAIEVVLSFVWLFIIAGLSVAAGLALSSKMDSMRGAIVVTLLLTMVFVPMLFSTLGFGGSVIAHDVWRQVPEGQPVWLPTAYERATFGWEYIGLLVALPLMSALLPGWFFYEVTIANLSGAADDRSSGIRKWALWSSLLLLCAAMIGVLVVDASDRRPLAMFEISSFALFVFFLVFVFAGEPIGPSRRVTLEWARTKASAFTRFFGPSVTKAASLALLVGVGGLGALTAVSMLALTITKSTTRAVDVGQILVVGFYAAAFSAFVIGFTAWIRARTNSPATARLLLLVTLFFISAGPWIIAAIVGAMAESNDGPFLLAAPSPFYAYYAASLMRSGSPSDSATLGMLGVGVSASAWALFGLALLGLASRRCRDVIRAHEAAIAETDARLAAEDAAQSEAAARADEQPPMSEIPPNTRAPANG
ncbi:MAG: ABC transporter permease [Polyangiaceae bacterium]